MQNILKIHPNRVLAIKLKACHGGKKYKDKSCLYYPTSIKGSMKYLAICHEQI